MSTIPANEIVNVVPSVLAAGGTGLNGTGLMLTNSTRIPLGAVQNFAIQQAVESYFGAGSYHAAEADIYFTGFEGASIQPSSLLMAQYNQNAVAAWMRGSAITLTLAQMQALSGSLTVVMDGYSHVISSIGFSTDGSFSAIAAAITSAFTDPTEASFTASLGASFTATGTGTSLVVTGVTGYISVGDTIAGTGVPSGTTIAAQVSGTAGGAGTYTTSGATTASSASITSVSTVLDVTALASGTIAVGQTLSGASVTGSPIIASQIGGTAGGAGLYQISGSQQGVAGESMTGVATAPTVTYDSTSGAFVITSGITGAPSTAAYATGTLAASLNWTSATGAVLSQGAAAASPSSFMTALIVQNSNWVNFTTLFDPDNGSGNAVKQAFAAWKNTALGGNRFGYVCWDPDASPTTANPATGSLGYILANNADSGTCLISEAGATEDTGLAAFILGAAASINFQQTNGRITFAFKAQAGLTANVSDPTTAGNLLGNGYNFYGAYGAANQNFIWFQTGSVTGPFKWFDSYQNQIWLNSQFQIQLLALAANSPSIPFSTAGVALIAGACQSVIQAGLNFRAFGPAALSATQIAEVNNAAGLNIASTLQSQGWYLLISVPGATVRAARGPWPITFWYIDQGSVQSITLGSVLVQ